MFQHHKRNSLFFVILALSGCVHLQSDKVSLLDVRYKYKKSTQHNIESKSATVSLYQNVLRPSLYSRCDFYPSDSAYAQVVAQRCGGGIALFKTFDRFLREPDAGYLGLPMLNSHYGISFIHLPESCEL